MITIMKGNIFKSQCKAIVNPISCDGIANGEISNKFKKMYPEMFNKYEKFCKDKIIDIGKIWIYKNNENDNWVINLPTRKSSKTKSKIKYIENGIDKFIETYKEKNIGSVAFPLLGCGNGKLDKKEVLSLLINKLVDCEMLYIEIWV